MSLYLDLVRLTAAIAVCMGHFAARKISGGFLYQFLRFGEPAVDVFFVLSGFVIGYVTSTREVRGWEYAINRLARVYSVAFPAIVLTAGLGLMLWLVSPEQNSALRAFETAGSARHLAAGLLFLNHLWFGASSPGLNGPYWSLCFEVWYYICYGILTFVPGRRRFIIMAVALCVAGPKIAALFPLWLMGVGCFQLCRRFRLGTGTGWVLWLGTLAALLLWTPDVARAFYPYDPLVLSVAYFRGDVGDYIVGSLFVVNIIAFHAISPMMVGFMLKISRPIRYVAGASFTIYLFHYPLLYFVAAVSPWQASDWRNRALVLLLVPPLLLLIARGTERQKGRWRVLFVRLFAPYRPADPAMAPQTRG